MPLSLVETGAGSINPGLHPRLQQLFTAWEHHRVNWCVLRMPTNPMAPDSDIDLLVNAEDIAAAEAEAEVNGFVRLPGKHLGVHLIAYDLQTSTWLWLHCVTELRFGPGQSVRGDATIDMLQRRILDLPSRLSPNDEFWVTLAHCLLDSRRVAPKHRQRLTALANESTAEHTLARGLNGLLPEGVTSEHLLQYCRLGRWDFLERLIPGVVDLAALGSRPGVFRRAVGRVRALRSRATEAKVRRGISVALLGPDGAGKSTLAAGIESTFVFPVRQMYMGLTGGMLGRVDRLGIPGVVRAGRLAVIWSRYLLAQYHVLRGRLVVFDRYIYDADVPTPHFLSPAARLGRWIDGRCCPAPDLVLLLDAPGPVMHQRKPSYTPEMIENWRQHFLKLRQRLPRMEVIDSTGSIEQVRTQAMALIWQQYSRRWPRNAKPVNRRTSS